MNATLVYSVPTDSTGFGVFSMISNTTGGYFCVFDPTQLDYFNQPTYLVIIVVTDVTNGVSTRATLESKPAM